MLIEEKNEADEDASKYLRTQLSYGIDFNTFNYEVNELIWLKSPLDELFDYIINLIYQ